MKTVYRTFLINMPKELIPIYDYLQSVLDKFFNDEKNRARLKKINLDQHKGRVWYEIRDEFTEIYHAMEIHNRAWHFFIVADNIRRILESQRKRLAVAKILEAYNWQLIEKAREELTKNKLYPTNALIHNLCRSKKYPELPYHPRFVLDYTVSEKQMFQKLDNNNFRIKVGKKDWIDYKIELPTSLRSNLTGEIAKPRFIKRRKDNCYVGHCSYEINTNEREYNEKGILGVDLGKIKPFSAVVLYPNGSYSKEYVCSKEIERIKEKLLRLYKNKNDIYTKNQRIEKYKAKDTYELLPHIKEQQQRRIQQLDFISSKITRLKEDLAKKMDMEIVYLADQNHCSEIHLEDLSWLASKAGKWHFSEIQDWVKEIAELFNIKVICVNARNTSKEHPITHEVGKVSNRVVSFEKTEQKIDRDVLASVNIAKRNKYGKKQNKVKKIRDKHTATPKRVNRKNDTRKQQAKKLWQGFNLKKRNTKIVVFSPNDTDCVNNVGSWHLTDNVKLNFNSLLCKNWMNQFVPISCRN